jgi:hypothetical protein
LNTSNFTTSKVDFQVLRVLPYELMIGRPNINKLDLWYLLRTHEFATQPTTTPTLTHFAMTVMGCPAPSLASDTHHTSQITHLHHHMHYTITHTYTHHSYDSDGMPCTLVGQRHSSHVAYTNNTNTGEGSHCTLNHCYMHQ